MTDATLTAIDPPGCSCTECIIGEYVPLDQATAENVRALFAGELRDNTETRWDIDQRHDGDGFDVRGGHHTVHLGLIAIPICVESYRLHANNDVIDTLVHGGRDFIA